ncbi:MAG TPA: ATP-binding protein [Casimicrobiaceae bacterium]|nr:ATP-binding protein [Casimicrobiaceae bacterium]
MRLAPRTLFGRLVAVILAGLVVAQLVSFYINASERDQILYRSGGMHVAQRIADLAALLDSMAPAERRKVAAVFDGQPLRIDLDRPPLPADASVQPGDFRLTVFATMLRRGLGDDLPVAIGRVPGAPVSPPRFGSGPPRNPPLAMMGDAPMRHPMMMGDGAFGPPPDVMNIVAQVRLHDGSLVTFDSSLPQEVTSVPLRIALTLLALLIVVIVLSLVAVRWVTVPLRTLASAADKLGRDLDNPPLPERGPLEVRQAAKAFNTMQQRLSRLIAERTRLFAAMSHDLKTPITRLRLRAELLDDEALQARFTKDLDEMEAMVRETLDYLRDTAAQEPVRPLDMNALLESLQHDYREGGGAVEIEGSASAPYLGRPLALRRCLTNVLDNALRYGKRATIVVEDATAALTVRVLDEGPGMPQGQLERAFEPFFRGDASRSRDTGGTGLGLGIARNMARAHGGELVLRNRRERGLEAVLTLPRASQASVPATA